MTLRLLVVEDHPLYKEALVATLHAHFDDLEVMSVDTFDNANSILKEHDDVDLVLLDLCLPDVQGFDGLMALRQTYCKIPVVVLSAFSDQAIMAKARTLGAAGFIPKKLGKEAMLGAIERVLSGMIVFDETTPCRQTAPRKSEIYKNIDTLTRRELRVLQLVCAGLSNKQIAQDLDVKESTAKAHVSNILKKLRVFNRTQIVLEISRIDLKTNISLCADQTSDGLALENCQYRVNASAI